MFQKICDVPAKQGLRLLGTPASGLPEAQPPGPAPIGYPAFFRYLWTGPGTDPGPLRI